MEKIDFKAKFEAMKVKALNGFGIDFNDAQILMNVADFYVRSEFLATTDKIMQKFFYNTPQKCSDGFTSNKCGNNCGYCFLSTAHWEYSQKNHLLPLIRKTPEDFLRDATEKENLGVTHYKIVSTCSRISDKEFALALEAYKLIRQNTNLTLCASMGLLRRRQLRKLKDVGVKYINFNFETSPRLFKDLGTNFSFDDKIKFNQLVAKNGLKRCSGMLVGLGDTIYDRIELGMIIKELRIESMPFNIFVPTPNFKEFVPEPEGLLTTLIILRLMLPRTRIIVNNGNVAFGRLFTSIFQAGANGYGARLKSYLSWARNV